MSTIIHQKQYFKPCPKYISQLGPISLYFPASDNWQGFRSIPLMRAASRIPCSKVSQLHPLDGKALTKESLDILFSFRLYLYRVLTGQMAIIEHGNAQYCTHVLIDPFRENDTLIFNWIPWPSHWKTWWNLNDVIIFCRDHADHGSYHDKLWCFVDGSKAAFTPEAKFSWEYCDFDVFFVAPKKA